MARVIYFDCFSGIAGDMTLGALIDLGVPLDAVRGALGSLGLDHELSATQVVRAGIAATHVTVRARSGASPAGTRHDRHSHPHDPGTSAGHRHGPDTDGGHRTVAEIVHLIDHSSLSAEGKAQAGAMIRRLAEAEAAIHAVPVSEVHLHEVGAVDSIVDIVGVVFALEWLGIDDVVSSPLNVGGGTVQIAHGTYPVPAPATLRLLRGVPMYGGDVQSELVTPTGALIVSTYARAYGPPPLMTVERIGYGAGTKDFPGHPNVVRVIVGDRVAGLANARADVVKIECEIDDMNPQLFGPAFDRLFSTGALDVFATPIHMKKGRPGTLLTVIGRPQDRQALADIVFRETTTIGIRFETMAREVLDRRSEEVTVEGGTIHVKVASRDGAVLNAAPEFDDCLRVATATGRPVKVVQADALRAWHARADKGHA
jgi:uncharacterized protein (TIGR00299 family) protein